MQVLFNKSSAKVLKNLIKNKYLLQLVCFIYILFILSRGPSKFYNFYAFFYCCTKLTRKTFFILTQNQLSQTAYLLTKLTTSRCETRNTT